MTNKENNIVENTELKKVLLDNLKTLNNATSQATINEMFEAMKKDQNHKDLTKFDKEVFIKYCWNLAGYSR